MLLGMSKPIHVLVPSVTARGIVNLSALAVLEAQSGKWNAQITLRTPPPNPLPRGEGK